MVRCLVLATGNPGKLREMREILGGVVGKMSLRVVGLDRFVGIGDFEETGATFAENARQKATAYSLATEQWCLADDSGLVVDALDGAPGVRSARYAADSVAAGAPRSEIDAANNVKLLKELDGLSPDMRTARFVCHLALADRQEILLEATGTVEGRIIRQPRGDNGFGYDPLFHAGRADGTMAELSPMQKNAISHRGQAVRRFAELLTELLQQIETE